MTDRLLQTVLSFFPEGDNRWCTANIVWTVIPNFFRAPKSKLWPKYSTCGVKSRKQELPGAVRVAAQ